MRSSVERSSFRAPSVAIAAHSGSEGVANFKTDAAVATREDAERRVTIALAGRAAARVEVALGANPQSFPEDAPLLEDWEVLRDGGCMTLVGAVSGHPRFDAGRRIRTSELVAIGVDLDWARTVNRFYRLRNRAGRDSKRKPP